MSEIALRNVVIHQAVIGRMKDGIAETGENRSRKQHGHIVSKT